MEKEHDYAAFMAAQKGIPREKVEKERIFAPPAPKNLIPCANCAHREVCMYVGTVQRMKEKIDEAVNDIHGDMYVASGLTIDFTVTATCPQHLVESRIRDEE